MKAGWMFGVALALVACGGEETQTEGVAVLGDNGELTEVNTLDLTTADGRTFVIDVRDDGGVAGDVTVNSRRGNFTLQGWVNDVALSHNLTAITSDDNTLILVTTVDAVIEDATPEDVASQAREQARSQANCPEECIHCPEDNVFLCQSMCGARH